jgi:LPXTG-motif cell wall-anchored protein
VPSVCRRIVVLLVVALLGAAVPVTAAHAQGAGDQQYEDPFGGSGSGSGSSGSGSSGSGSGSSGGSGTIQPITPAPQTAGSGSGTGSSGSSGSSGTAGTSSSGTATPSPSSPAATGQLPNTGLDTRVLVVAGVVLVLAGAGLRLRNAPDRF